MNPIVIPQRYTYIEAYLTFRCCFSCPWCMNKQGGISMKREEMDATKWVLGLNRIESENDVPITIGGGEPTLHPDFYEIVNGLRAGLKIDLLTNLQFEPMNFIADISPRRFSRHEDAAHKSIRASYHPHAQNPFELVHKAAELQKAGFRIGLFGISHPQHLSDNTKMAEICREREVYFFVKDFLGVHDGRDFGYYAYPESVDGVEKNCLCRTKELLIAPDGYTHRCHRDLYVDDFHIGHICEDKYEFTDSFIPCNHYGTCSRCDTKAKLNRYLDDGNCSVEIKAVE